MTGRSTTAGSDRNSAKKERTASGDGSRGVPRLTGTTSLDSLTEPGLGVRARSYLPRFARIGRRSHPSWGGQTQARCDDGQFRMAQSYPPGLIAG